ENMHSFLLLCSLLIYRWGDEIEWVQTYEEGLATSRNSKKPLVVSHHLEECPYSQGERGKPSKTNYRNKKCYFHCMFSLNNLFQHSTSDDNLAPDGYYVPRILFADPSMTIQTDLTGKNKNKMYAYEPEDISILVENVRQAKILLHTEL
uniref:Uncharacterized protein n=1 Tax=Crocodylus porosus TaxID=8502 RepID=A0A7M4FU73_CROPO